MTNWNLKDLWAEENGMTVTETTEKTATTEMIVERKHLNGVGVCQGGALFTLADLAMAAVTNQTGMSVSTDANIRFLVPAKEGDHLVCRCNIVKDGRLPVVEGDIRIDDKIIAVFGGRDYRL